MVSDQLLREIGRTSAEQGCWVKDWTILAQNLIYPSLHTYERPQYVLPSLPSSIAASTTARLSICSLQIQAVSVSDCTEVPHYLQTPSPLDGQAHKGAEKHARSATRSVTLYNGHLRMLLSAFIFHRPLANLCPGRACLSRVLGLEDLIQLL
jgi:hypothetical protein